MYALRETKSSGWANAGGKRKEPVGLRAIPSKLSDPIFRRYWGLVLASEADHGRPQYKVEGTQQEGND